jgi:hypothetical protein
MTIPPLSSCSRIDLSDRIKASGAYIRASTRLVPRFKFLQVVPITEL